LTSMAQISVSILPMKSTPTSGLDTSNRRISNGALRARGEQGPQIEGESRLNRASTRV
jgi:hypothetical protein